MGLLSQCFISHLIATSHIRMLENCEWHDTLDQAVF